jgi:excisionase family DNA binding protein
MAQTMQRKDRKRKYERKPRKLDPESRLSFSISEWSELLGTSRQTTWRAIKKGQIRTVDVAGRKRIPASERTRLLTGQTEMA